MILGVMAGMAVPNFRGSYSKLELSEAAKNIAYLMRYTQGRASLKGKEHLIEFDVNARTFILKEKSGEDDLPNASGVFQDIQGRFGGVQHIPADLILETQKPQVHFYPDGKIEKARIFLKNKQGQYFTVSTQEQLGYVQIYDFKLDNDNENLQEPQ